MNWKLAVRKLPFAEVVNAKIKSFQLKSDLECISKEYKARADKLAYSYDATEALCEFRRRLRLYRPNYVPPKIGDLKVFWVGSNLSQDESGFLQALQKISTVTVFLSEQGNYGSWDGSSDTGKLSSLEEIRLTNDKALLNQIKHINNEQGIDIVFGQMWAHRFSKDALIKIQRMGIPVLNISMDDRLPINWSQRDGIRLGSVGLVSGLDMVLTTCSETCLWYGVEGCPSLFWPLASSPEIFATKQKSVRDIDVLFIGNKYGARTKIISYLEKHGVKVDCYGAGWPNGSVNAEEMASLSKRARIILGIGTVGHCDDVYTLKLRDFDAPMSNALYLTHRNPDLIKLYVEGEEIECYVKPSEALKKISFFLKNPSQLERVANKGYHRAFSEHTWHQRILNTFVELGLIQENETLPQE